MATPSRPDRKSSETAGASAPGRPASRSGSKKKNAAKAGGGAQTTPQKKTSRQPVAPVSEDTTQATPQAYPERLGTPVPMPGEAERPASEMPSSPGRIVPEAENRPAVETETAHLASDNPVAPSAPDVLPPPEASPPQAAASAQQDKVAGPSEPEAAPPEPIEAPVRPAYDVTGFLIGVFEGLPGSADLSLDCVVAPRTDTVAVERLLYFSQALQLLFSAFRSPGMDRRHPAEKTAPQRLHIRLDLGPGERIGLRLYDDGHFFAQLLPSLHWDEEALRPLRLFVSRKGGSLCLRRGRCVEFEIIG